MPVSWRATSWDWQLTSAWALCALMQLQRWVWAFPLSSIKIRKKRFYVWDTTDNCFVHSVMKLVLNPPPSLFLFLVPLAYSAMCAFWEYEHICFDVCFTPAQTSHSCLQIILARAMQTPPLVHIMWMHRAQALPYCSLSFWPYFLQCEAAMLPKDVTNVARVLFTEINAQNIIHMFTAIADNTLGGITL